MLSLFSFHRCSLATRLSMGFGVMLALVLGIAATGVAALVNGNQAQGRSAQVIAVQQLTRSLLLEMTLDETRTLAIIRSAGMPEVVDRFKPDLQASAPRLQKLLAELVETGDGLVSPAQRTALGLAFGKYLSSRDKVIGLVETGQTIQATAAESSVFVPARNAWRQGVASLAGAIDAQAQQSLADASRIGTLAVQLLVAGALVAATAGLLWARAISSSIARPILGATWLSSAIAEGDLLEKPEREAPLLREGGEPGQLLQALLTMRASLLAIAHNTTQSAATVSTASESMALAAQSLAIRTEEQTQSIVSVRGQVDQVVGQIQLTADKARAGEQQCLQLQASARSGQQAASQAVDTIERVAQGSLAMYEVVSLIESIAFQINILSLNAAVEAARAGAAGAGFAVVAAEVRTLAKRAADSVRAIRDQIHGAAEQMQTGVQSVQDVATLLRDMHGRVVEVAERARDISNDTRRQTEALALASQGLAQLADLNAANTEMVVLTVHGCEALRTEASQLLEHIAQRQAAPASGGGDGADVVPQAAAATGTASAPAAEYF